MPILTALGLLMAIAAVIALVQEGKDPTTKSLVISAIVVGAVFILYPYTSWLRDIAPHHGTLYIILSIAAAVIAVLVALRVKNRAIGAVCCCGAGLIALEALHAIDW